MSLTPILEVAISLALLYLFFSQVVLSVFEWIASKINLRGRFLRYQLNKALNSGNDKNWAELMYRHPSVDMLAQTTSRPPTYVPSSVFVKAIIDLVIDEARTHEFVPQSTGEYDYQVTDPGAGQMTTLAKFEAGLAKVSPGDFKRLLQSLLLNARGCTTTGAGGDERIFAEFVQGLAVWYDNYMERVSGWYKREIRPYLFAIGLVLAIASNLDSLYVARYFWEHAEDRRRVADYATIVVQQGPPPSDGLASTNTAATPLPPIQEARRLATQTDSLTRSLQAHGYPIGWTIAPTGGPTPSTPFAAPNLQQPWWLIAVGWLLTGAALSFGAPFWFELLNRFVNMRNQGLRPPTATATSSKEPS